MALLTFVVASLIGLPVCAQTSEETVKATFLYRFVSFITWPADSFATADSAVTVCVIGADPFAHALNGIAARQHISGRPLDVRRLAGAAAIDACHIVYVVGNRADAVLRAARGRPILTITDGASDGGDRRGVIHFAVVDNRVRFHIDDARAAESSLLIDPRLLSLALSVRRRAGA